jgi:peroxiredoxin
MQVGGTTDFHGAKCSRASIQSPFVELASQLAADYDESSTDEMSTPVRSLLMRVPSLLITCLAMASLSPADDGPRAPSEIGRKIENFTLRDFRGKAFELTDLKDHSAIVVVFVGTECPIANSYAARLRELSESFEARGVAFVGINSNSQDSITEIAHWAQKNQVRFPLLKDVGNKVADLFGARRTPEAYVLDRNRVVRYRGRIDDQYSVGLHRPKPTATYLADAVQAVLDEKPVAVSLTESVGCIIGRVRPPGTATDITYSRDIAPVLQNRCVTCHREGEIAPFALTNYDEVAGWAAMIDEVVQEGRMPPWHASPQYGQFANDPRLSDEEKQAIHQWARAGAPQGDPKHLPAARVFTPGWQIPTPDLVLAIQKQPFDVDATGQLAYQHFVVDPGFREDRWIRAAECRPGNRAVVHHIIAFIQPPGTTARAEDSIKSLWLAATAPGAVPLNLPDGLAKCVPAGSKFVFQVHYTPNGTPEQDLSHLGLVFTDAASVRKEVGIWRAANMEFEIPPGDPDYEVTASRRFRRDTLLLNLFPHMHLRGKSFRYEAHFPDGSQEILLDVPRYDFAWQISYELQPPRLMPAGTRLVCKAVFDNSPGNLNNPDPTVTVRWGDQTTDEMMAGHFDVVLADQDLTKETKPMRRTDRFLSRVKESRSTIPDEFMQRLAAALEHRSPGADQYLPFATLLQEQVPQLDRVDLTVLQGKELVTILDADLTEFDPPLRGKGTKLPAADLSVAAHARTGEFAVHDLLSSEDAPDLKFMARAFASSLHIPVRVDDQSSTVNFWSEESAGFPAEAVSILRQAAELLASRAATIRPR